MNTRLIDLINVAGSPRITVIGDLILDSYIQGDADRISPEAPIQVLNAKKEHHALGGAANVAANLRNLGAVVELCGITGDDGNGELLREMFDDKGIGFSAVLTDAKRPTINKVRVMAHNQQLVRIDREECDPLDETVEERLFESTNPLLERSDIVVLSDYAKGVLTPSLIQKIIEHSPADILVDPKGRDYRRYSGCRLITPNRTEAEVATGIKLETMEDLKRAAGVLFKDVDLKELVITLGSDGIFYTRSADDGNVVPARARSVYDVTGAGDTVISVLAFCLAIDMDLDDAVRVANAAAGIVVGKLGVAAPTRLELAEFFSGGKTRYKDKILSLAEAQTAAEEVRYCGEILVLATGCFDLFHSGHVSYLNAAKGLGDHLMVGVNSDASAARIKGAGRPIIKLDERMELLASMQMVDSVVSFAESTPLNLVQSITPHILVKGEDWGDRSVVGRDWVEAHGGEVALIPMKEGLSISGMIRRITRRQGAAPKEKRHEQSGQA